MTQVWTRFGWGTAVLVIAAAAGCGGGGGSPGSSGNAGLTGSGTGGMGATVTGGATGGTGSGNGAATTTASGSEVPMSALQSVGGLIAYLHSLAGSPSETARPVVLGDITLPTDDAAAPSPLQ